MLLLFLLFLIFVYQSYEDYKHKSINLVVMLTGVFLTLFITWKLISIYILSSLLYYKFRKICQKHLGFGDVWYLVVFFYYFSHYYYILCINLLLASLWGSYAPQASNFPLLPILLVSILMGFVFNG